MSKVKLSHLMDRRALITVPINTPISEAMQLMGHAHITAVCVTRHDKLVGIFTMKDVMSRVLGFKTSSIWRIPKKRKIKDVPVRVLMSGDPVTIHKNDSLENAVQLMKLHRVRHFPVTYNDELCGIVTLRDVIEGIRINNMNDRKEAKLNKRLESMYSENLYRKLAPVKIRNR